MDQLFQETYYNTIVVVASIKIIDNGASSGSKVSSPLSVVAGKKLLNYCMG
jgi:hypothetical protein